eukprot:TRINITY_DN14485_c0_g1_i1.p1 TRINITY_DN14485_c0_g1~~TRINITY_DN14485_c0_g1_i1.p1  ORF type:complete len:188 (+),score=38.01 TRINITY_DN14485_c0_g1_i1:35-565(+)
MAILILTFLPLQDLGTMRQVSKWSQALSDQDDLWQKLVARDFQVSECDEDSWRESYKSLWMGCDLFVGDTVVRSDDWSWDNQDGGIGHEGKVLMRANWSTNERSELLESYDAVDICWSGGDNNNIYRFGHQDKFDIRPVLQHGKHVNEARWKAAIARRKAKQQLLANDDGTARLFE